jgi:cytochrome c-type biogenesis protein CcmH
VTRKWAPWLVLVVLVAGAVAVLVVRSQPSDSVEARAGRLERELACPVCTGESLAESNAPEARAMRDDMRERMAAGQSDGEIVAAYVRLYGERVKLKPDDGGVAVLAWGLPVVLFVVGGAALVAALVRWSRTPRLEPEPEDERLVARARGETP